MIRYERFNVMDIAGKARNYLTSMVDKRHDCLPYWFVQINEAPAYARHVRVDDAELVASWYEAIVCLKKILGPDIAAEAVEKAFQRHLMKSWGPKGLRYHESYPWSSTKHASFHEAGYVLSALNRLLGEEPDNREAENRASRLVHGMRELVIHRKTRTFWSGDFDAPEKIYEFPGDLYLHDGGWVPERYTGRGEAAIRNAVILQGLAVRAEKFKDEAALDLAEGIANHLLGLSRYFNWKGEFFGHVHSSVWAAIGLAKLGRLNGNAYYIEKADQIFTYARSLSSEFGWVPEYAQWHPIAEEHCETCCIRDMIECALELCDCGYDYWDLANKFVRNQLAEQQIKDGSFISVDNAREDADGCTWQHLDQRVVGGWSGGGEPNSISLARFRSIAGCCVGTAPQALHCMWDRTIEHRNDGIYINFPIEKEDQTARVEIGYPNQGSITITAEKEGDYFIRHFDWMGSAIELRRNGIPVPLIYSNSCIMVPQVKKGESMLVAHPLHTVVKNEQVRGVDLSVSWRGPDVIAMNPPGLPLRLYQREENSKKEYPQPIHAKSSGLMQLTPTDQKK